MKTENTLENKAKFFAQYWGVEVVNYGKGTKLTSVDFVDFIDLKNELFLQLTPLSQITDEDAIACAKLIYGDYHIEQMFNVLSKEKALFEIHKSINDTTHFMRNDFLRSKGYALPYMDLSVKDLISYGWVKLKS